MAERLHHLRPLRAVSAEARQSLLFTLMAAAHHMAEGETRAGTEALCDAVWLLHKGTHERVSDRDLIVALRKVTESWSPEPGDDAA